MKRIGITLAVVALAGFGGWMGWEWTHPYDVHTYWCHMTTSGHTTMRGPNYAYDPWVGHEVLKQWVHPGAVHAGHPACDPKQPKRAPCDMKSCTQMGPDGKPNGAKCSSYCAKSCCSCPTTCVPDYPGTGPNPDDEGQNPDEGQE